MGRIESPGPHGVDPDRQPRSKLRVWGIGIAVVALVTIIAAVAVGSLDRSAGGGESSVAQPETSTPDRTDDVASELQSDGSSSTTTAPEGALTTTVPLTTVVVAPTDSSTTSTTADVATPESVFSETSPFNAPIPDDPVLDAQSDRIAAALGEKVVANVYEFGIAVYEVDADTAPVTIECTRPWGTCLLDGGQHRVPVDAVPAPGSDATLVVVDWAERRTVEMWQAVQLSDAAWSTSWGTTTPIDGTGVPAVFGNGAGVSHLAGVVRTGEIERGSIDHALAFSTSNSCHTEFRYPATKTDGASKRPDCIPEGTRVQLDPSIDVDSLDLTPAERMIARALQMYGAYAIDTGGTTMALIFEIAADATSSDPGDAYANAGLTQDYFDLRAIPWEGLRVLSAWDGT